MKKFLAVSLVLSLILIPFALAEIIDLSSLSFEELDALRDQCQYEMMKRDDWQEVTVPQGVYRVGVHIPAGTWTVRCNTGSAMVEWGDTLEVNEQNIDYMSTDRYDRERIYDPTDKYYHEGQRTEYAFSVLDGEWIIIKDRPVIFTPGSPTPSFSFK